MIAPASPLSRVSPAAVSVETVVSAAVSHRSLPVTLDATRLLALGCACRRAAILFATLAHRVDRETRRGERADTGEAADHAQGAFDLEESAQALQALAQDATYLELLVYKHRLDELLVVARGMDRGLVFVPVEPVEAARLPAPAAVVVVGQDDAPAPGLRARAGAALARPKKRAA